MRRVFLAFLYAFALPLAPMRALAADFFVAEPVPQRFNVETPLSLTGSSAAQAYGTTQFPTPAVAAEPTSFPVPAQLAPPTIAKAGAEPHSLHSFFSVVRKAARPNPHGSGVSAYLAAAAPLHGSEDNGPEASGGRVRFDGAGGGDPIADWARSLPEAHRFPGAQGFASFYDGFAKDLDRRFVAPEYAADRAEFLHDVEQGRFHAKDDAVGELEAKLIDGQVAIRFVPKTDAAPLVALWVNVPLAVNVGVPPVAVRSPGAPSPAKPDPAVASRDLDVYRSRLLVNRKIGFSRLFKDGSIGAPFRGVMIVDQAGGKTLDSAFSPALRSGSRRWFKHWAKAIPEKARYGDVVRGVVSSSIQFGLGYGLASLAQSIHKVPNPAILAPAALSGLFALVLASFAQTYVNFIQHGDNRSWESFKRLVIGALFLSYPLAFMQSGGHLDALLSWSTTLTVWLVGFGDPYLSSVMNVVPKLHQKYFMKPWFFPVRVKAPFGERLARLTGRDGFKVPITGALLTRETLAILRFPIKFFGLFLDPVLMHWTHGVPVATILLWSSGLPFEVYNYRVIKRLAKQHPRIQEDLEKLQKGYRRLLPGFLARRLFPVA